MFDYAQKIMDAPDAPTQINALYEAMKSEEQRRREFREWLTPEVKAEFINGQVIMHSPVKRRHWKASDLLSRLLSIYASVKKLGSVGVEKVLVALTRNDYEPDLVYYSKEKVDAFTDDQMLFPAPDFIVEILSPSTANRDKGIKLKDYAAHGIREYWIIDPTKKRIEKHILLSKTDKKYLPPKIYILGESIDSLVIEGFEIPVDALFDEAVNLETLQMLLSGKIDD